MSDAPDLRDVETLAVDFETSGTDDLHNPGADFLRVLGWYGERPDGTVVSGSTSDPEMMREVLMLGVGKLLWFNGPTFDIPAASTHLELDLSDGSRDAAGLARAVLPKFSDKESRSLAACADLLGVTGKDEDTRDDLLAEFGSWADIPRDDPRLHAYCIRDCEVTLRVRQAAEARAGRYAVVQDAADQITARLNLRGYRVDPVALEDEIARAEDRRVRLREEFEAVGIPATRQPWSTKAAREKIAELAEAAGLLGDWPLTKKGAPQLGRAVLSERLPAPTPELDHLIGLNLRGGELQHDFPLQVRNTLGANGRSYPAINDTSINGRWKSKDPNVLGAGKRSAGLVRERSVYLPEPNQVLIGADLSGIDNRAVAGLSGDEAYLDLITSGDIHQTNADLLGLTRKEAKVFGHGVNYGMQANTLSRLMKVSVDRAQDVLDRFDAAYPDVAAWKDHVRDLGGKRRVLDNGFGRLVRALPDDEFTTAPARVAASCARDLLVVSLMRSGDRDLLRRVWLVVHDEAILQVDPDEVDEYRERLARAMTWRWGSPSGLVVPIEGALFLDGDGPDFATRWSGLYLDEFDGDERAEFVADLAAADRAAVERKTSSGGSAAGEGKE